MYNICNVALVLFLKIWNGYYNSFQFINCLSTVQSDNGAEKVTLLPIIALMTVAASHGHMIAISAFHSWLPNKQSQWTSQQSLQVVVTWCLP